MGLFDALQFGGSSGGGGLLDFLRQYSAQNGNPSIDPSATQNPPLSQQSSAPDMSGANMIPIGGYNGYMMPSFGQPSPASAADAGSPSVASAPALSANAQMPQQAQQAPQGTGAPSAGLPSFLQPQNSQGGFGGAFRGMTANMAGGPLGMLFGGIAGGMGMGQGDPRQQELDQKRELFKALAADPSIGPNKAMIAVSNPQIFGQLQAQANSTRDFGEKVREFNYSQAHSGDMTDYQKAVLAQSDPAQAASLRDKLATAHGLKPGSPEYNAYVLNGKLPDTTANMPNSVGEYQFYLGTFKPTPETPTPMDYATFSTSKARAGATNISNNVDMGGPQAYDKVVADAGLAKPHAALMSGVEDAQSRARDVAAMQGAVDAIQKNDGTTGGMAQEQILNLQKTINQGANALGIEQPFSLSDISDKEFLTKFNRQMAGQMAKGAVGNRVTNFEMKNYLAANPGLQMSLTGNQRLLGIQAQIERRNIEVGNQMRAEAARATAKGERINPVTMQKIITDYDQQHHVQDPVTGQDLTQSYTLPEFQTGGTNPALTKRNSDNMGKMRMYDPATGTIR